ncbi:MAG TPA: EFR1 family ferrodoxin [Oscillospiraceae bacterium]|nr:EFR1 family ferrodoxin [Oscillospiraceae bacterium]
MGIQSVNIVFFSGTGGTRYVAENMKSAFENKETAVTLTELNTILPKHEQADLYILLYPVYAMNAPIPIDEWIENSPNGKGKPAAVLSVSGGGEVTPNTACRSACKKMLTKKGYDVVYERMIVMPSNWIVRGDDSIAVRLLRKLPQTSKKIADDLLSEKKRFTKPKLIDSMLSKISVVEKKESSSFGNNISVSDDCISCGLCEKKCPRQNIHMSDSKPVFGNRCVICLNCIYSCPKRALEPKKLKFVVIKEGFNFNDFFNKINTDETLPPIEETAKGAVWAGVRKYLKEID